MWQTSVLCCVDNLLSRQVHKPYVKKGFFGPLSPTNYSFKYNRILLCFLLKCLSSKNQCRLTPPSQALTTGNTKPPTVELRTMLGRTTPTCSFPGTIQGGLLIPAEHHAQARVLSQYGHQKTWCLSDQQLLAHVLYDESNGSHQFFFDIKQILSLKQSPC